MDLPKPPSSRGKSLPEAPGDNTKKAPPNG